MLSESDIAELRECVTVIDGVTGAGDLVKLDDLIAELRRLQAEVERLAKLVRCYPDSVDCGPTFVCPTCEASDRGGFVVHAADCPRMEFDRRYPLKDSGAA